MNVSGVSVISLPLYESPFQAGGSLPRVYVTGALTRLGGRLETALSEQCDTLSRIVQVGPH